MIRRAAELRNKVMIALSIRENNIFLLWSQVAIGLHLVNYIKGL